MLNPYSDQDFFGFFRVFFQRVFQFCVGDLPLENFVSDELQILVLSLVALSSALVGSFLVLKKMTMLANALSHTMLLGIVSVYLLLRVFQPGMNFLDGLTIPALFGAALITGLMTAFLTETLTRLMGLQEDASIGLVFSILFALGVVLVSVFSSNVHIGTELVMGNADALQPKDLRIVLTIFACNACIFFFFFNGFKITAFDRELARFFCIFPLGFHYLLMILTAATAIGAFRAVGVLLVLAYLVIPPLIARYLTHNLRTMIALSMFFGVLASLLGVALSRHFLTTFGFGLSTGGLVATLLGIFFLATLIFSPQRGLFFQFFYRLKLRRNL